MITDVAIDLDGVMYPFDKEFRKFCSKALGRDDLPHATHWHFYEDWGLNAEEYHHLLIEATRAGVFLHGEPPIGAQAAWDMIRAMGVKIHVITARPQEAWADTTWWLDHWNFKADNLYFTGEKWLYAYITGDNKTMMLDDSPEYLRSVQHYPHVIPVAFDQPWNKDLDVVKVQTLMGFARLIALYNAYSDADESETWV